MTAKAKQSQVVTLPHAAGTEMSVHPGTMISHLMTAKDIDIDKLQGLFDLQLKYDNEIARKAYHTAKARFAALAPTILYDDEADFTVGGKQTKYGFATLAGTLDQIRSALQECGLNVSWKTDDSLEGGNLRVTCFMTHDLGYQEETSLSAERDAGKGATGMNSLQAVKSTVSYLERITLYALAGLASRGDDDDGKRGGGPEPIAKISTSQLKTLTTKIAKVGIESAKILELFSVETLADIDIVQLKQVHAMLNLKANADKEGAK